MKLIVLIMVLAAGLVVYGTQVAIDERFGSLVSEDETLYLPSGTVIRSLSLGHYGLIADLYWMRAVQYYGGKRLKNESNFRLLEPLIRISTTLDPQLLHAYRFGSIFLSEKPPVGAGQPEKAIELLKKGIEANPKEWQLFRDLGFVYYWYLGDYPAAARSFLEGSKDPSSAPWMKAFAAELMAKGGNRQNAKFLWEQFYESSDNEAIRNNARENLIRLRALDEIDILQGMVSKAEDKLGRRLNSLSELIELGMLRKPPLDPKGFPYIYDRDTGAVRISDQSTVRRF